MTSEEKTRRLVESTVVGFTTASIVKLLVPANPYPVTDMRLLVPESDTAGSRGTDQAGRAEHCRRVGRRCSHLIDRAGAARVAQTPIALQARCGHDDCGVAAWRFAEQRVRKHEQLRAVVAVARGRVGLAGAHEPKLLQERVALGLGDLARSRANSTRAHLARLEPLDNEYGVSLLEIYHDAATTLEDMLTWYWLRFEIAQRTALLELHREMERNRRRTEWRLPPHRTLEFYAEADAREQAMREAT